MEENMNYEKAIEEYGKVLLNYKKIEPEKRLNICTEYYGMLYMQAEMYQGIKEGFNKESELVRKCINILIPILENTVKDVTISNELMIKFYELYEKAYYFAARRSFKHYLLAMEFKWSKKVFKQRINLFEPIIYYLNKMALDNDIKLLRISMPPRICKKCNCNSFQLIFVWNRP